MSKSSDEDRARVNEAPTDLHPSGFDRVCEDERSAEAELLAALREARNDIAAWGAYASEYFKDKWDLDGQVLPAIEQACIRDLPDIVFQSRKPGSKPGPEAEMIERKRRPHRGDLEIYAFPQTWSDTALGFGGIAGQAFTDAYTTVIISDHRVGAVYMGGRLAYLAEVTAEFREDLGRHEMPGATELKGRYKIIGKPTIDEFF